MYFKPTEHGTLGRRMDDGSNVSRYILENMAKSLLNTVYGYHAGVTTYTNPIRKVIFNPPATIVFWFDGSKTVVKARGDDEFDPETGLAMAISKHYLCDICGLKRYDGIFNKFIPRNQKNKE